MVLLQLPVLRGYDSILVVYNRFLKISHFIMIIEKIMVKGLTNLFRNNMWKLYRLSKSVILDRGPQFVAELMKKLNEILGIKTKLSIAFYSQTDRQRGQIKSWNSTQGCTLIIDKETNRIVSNCRVCL